MNSKQRRKEQRLTKTYLLFIIAGMKKLLTESEGSSVSKKDILECINLWEKENTK